MPKASKSSGTEKFKKNGNKHDNRRTVEEDYEQVFQLAVNQEEQGERYQFGAKAKRNYEQSIQSYRLSIDLLSKNPSDRPPSDGFNSHFNLARALVNFGTTFSSAPSECLKLVQHGIQEYQHAVEYAIKDSNQSDEIDARYNLGLGLSTAAEMLSAGAMLEDDGNGSVDYHSMAIQGWKQAKEELSRAYQLQERLLSDSKNLGPGVLGDKDMTSQTMDEPMQEENRVASPANGQTTLVEEVFIITPSVLIDTLMDICEVLLSIYTSEPELVSTELRQYIQQLQSVNQTIVNSNCPNFSRQFEIDSLICNIELTIIEHAFSESLEDATSSPNSIFEMGQKLSAVNQKLEELSADSNALDQDFLNLLGLATNFSSLCTATCSLITIRSDMLKSPIPDVQLDELECLIKKTIGMYTIILEKLKQSKLRPIKQIKSHEVSSYISSSLVGQSELALILELLHHQRGIYSTSQPKSFDLAIEAYNQSLGPYKISHPSTLNSLKLEFTSARQPRSTNADEVRDEWSNFSVRLESIKLLLRSKFHHLRLRSNDKALPGLEQTLIDEIAPLITKFELSRTDLIRFYDDFLNDPVFILSRSIEKPMFDFLLRSHNHNV
ncbi:hypothetical protein PTTG_25096 [Puccinia triticina 1-1 BBBD Race 1]|uniref:Uncharacterized protein n=1 Tax=Puccinia triticina (isolate 1-1 / race 1 (BBBD)) TaxID=630390 RepID=A0A180H5W2_PUCT1|nr:hypothetical protein PTTG_25096 [Puccinia triticina 1-1 BBBD Race 1]WAR60401.1 hypothetical protein PtB15_9B340 [Puccinia triticina]